MEQNPETRRRAWWLMLAGGICCVALVAVMGLVVLNIRSGAGEGFDADRWRQAQEGCTSDNPRLGMYSDLRSELLRDRPTESGVLEMLGSPDVGRSPRTVSYMLGYNIIDCDMVEIHFGPDGRVSEVHYVQG